MKRAMSGGLETRPLAGARLGGYPAPMRPSRPPPGGKLPGSPDFLVTLAVIAAACLLLGWTTAATAFGAMFLVGAGGWVLKLNREGRPDWKGGA